ncbi:MAG: hypothetical protein Q8K85_10200, partial [Hyphomicrobium sp.]|nr:hypothetical protein [Hyphomicrobium sp.]
MQHVVLEVLELVVRRLGAREIGLGMLQEQTLPAIRLRARQLPERIERQLVVRALGVGSVNDPEQQRHAEPSFANCVSATWAESGSDGKARADIPCAWRAL